MASEGSAHRVSFGDVSVREHQGTLRESGGSYRLGLSWDVTSEHHWSLNEYERMRAAQGRVELGKDGRVSAGFSMAHRAQQAIAQSLREAADETALEATQSPDADRAARRAATAFSRHQVALCNPMAPPQRPGREFDESDGAWRDHGLVVVSSPGQWTGQPPPGAEAILGVRCVDQWFLLDGDPSAIHLTDSGGSRPVSAPVTGVCGQWVFTALDGHLYHLRALDEAVAGVLALIQCPFDAQRPLCGRLDGLLYASKLSHNNETVAAAEGAVAALRQLQAQLAPFGHLTGHHFAVISDVLAQLGIVSNQSPVSLNCE